MALYTDRIRKLPALFSLAAAILGASCQTPPADSPAAAGQGTSGPSAAADARAAALVDAAEGAGPVAPAPAAASSSGSLVTTGTHVFQVRVPAIGTRALESETEAMSLSVSITRKDATSPVKADWSERETAERIVEVLAANTEAVTKVKVTYKAHSLEKKEDGADKSRPSPVQGKVYFVEAKDGAIQVSLPSGSAPTDQEVKVVEKDFRRLGKPDMMQKAIPTGPIQAGARVDAIGNAVKDRLAGEDDPGETTTFGKVEVTFLGVRDEGGGKVGVFTVVLDVNKTDDTLSMSLAVKGKVEVGLADGMPVAMSFESPVVVAAENANTGTRIVGAGRATKLVTRKVQ